MLIRDSTTETVSIERRTGIIVNIGVCAASVIATTIIIMLIM